MSPPTVYRGLSLRYGADPARLSPTLGHAFVELGADASTRAFVDDCIARPTSTVKLAARGLARRFLSDYDANALFDTHDMRVCGTEQWRILLCGRARGRLLDVGAGDGRVTRELAALFDAVVTTELSSRMAERLRACGYACHEVDLTTTPLPDEGRFEVVSLLNVIDRTSHPITLLERARDQLAPDGTLIVAVPLPLSPHVHIGPRTVDPEERLPIDRRSFEQAAVALASDCFAPLGLYVRAWSRVPYLSRGDGRVPAYVLDDSVWLLGRTADRRLA